jgi:hypothetical protein
MGLTMGSEFKWRHFAGELILLCVRWYCKYGRHRHINLMGWREAFAWGMVAG